MNPAAARSGTQHRLLLSREVCIRHLFVLTLKLPELPWLGNYLVTPSLVYFLEDR